MKKNLFEELRARLSVFLLTGAMTVGTLVAMAPATASAEEPTPGKYAFWYSSWTDDESVTHGIVKRNGVTVDNNGGMQDYSGTGNLVFDLIMSEDYNGETPIAGVDIMHSGSGNEKYTTGTPGAETHVTMGDAGDDNPLTWKLTIIGVDSATDEIGVNLFWCEYDSFMPSNDTTEFMLELPSEWSTDPSAEVKISFSKTVTNQFIYNRGNKYIFSGSSLDSGITVYIPEALIDGEYNLRVLDTVYTNREMRDPSEKALTELLTYDSANHRYTMTVNSSSVFIDWGNNPENPYPLKDAEGRYHTLFLCRDGGYGGGGVYNDNIFRVENLFMRNNSEDGYVTYTQNGQTTTLEPYNEYPFVSGSPIVFTIKEPEWRYGETPILDLFGISGGDLTTRDEGLTLTPGANGTYTVTVTPAGDDGFGFNLFWSEYDGFVMDDSEYFLMELDLDYGVEVTFNKPIAKDDANEPYQFLSDYGKKYAFLPSDLAAGITVKLTPASGRSIMDLNVGPSYFYNRNGENTITSANGFTVGQDGSVSFTINEHTYSWYDSNTDQGGTIKESKEDGTFRYNTLCVSASNGATSRGSDEWWESSYPREKFSGAKRTTEWELTENNEDPYSSARVIVNGVVLQTSGENGTKYNHGAVEFRRAADNKVYLEIGCMFNQTFSKLLINGKDYSSYVPSTAQKILDAIDVDKNGQTMTIKLPGIQLDDGISIDCQIENLDNKDVAVGNYLWFTKVPGDAMEEDKDACVDGGYITFKKLEYNGKTYNSLAELQAADKAYLSYDDAGNMDDPSYNPDAHSAVLPAGSVLTLKFVPKYGKQLTKFQINGFTPAASDTAVGEYTFTVPAGNFHLAATFTDVADKAVTKDAAEVASAGVKLDANELANGSAVLTVKDTTPNTATATGFANNAGTGYKVDSYLDLKLANVIYKASASDKNAWSTDKSSLNKAATITLNLTEAPANTDGLKVLHQKHDGTYETLSATYNASTKTVSFKTTSFSTFAIVVKSGQNGWVETDAGWTYYDANGAKVTGWKQIGNKWYYMNSKGIMTTGWQQIGNKWYYMDSKGVMTTGWKQIGNKWYYMDSKGVMTTGWKQIGGKWYYMDSKGVMQTGWKQLGGKWYYMDSKGIMQTGWKQIGGKWYYLKSGVMLSGWQKIDGKWYYLKSGVMLSGWQKIDGKWYYLKGGVMLSGWQKINNKWYYLKSGAMVDGWQKIGTKWYYFQSGIMQTGWVKSGSKWYFFRTGGDMVANTTMTIAGKKYSFDASGAMK